MTDDYLPRGEFDRYVKATNGSLGRIEAKLDTLDAKLDQTFFGLQARMDDKCEKLDEKIDAHVPKWVAVMMSFLSAATIGLLSALIVVLTHR